MRPRLFGILLVLAGAMLAAPAQTNAPAKVRQLSLQDCIQLTLEHNLDLQIDRYDASLSLYALQGAYGAYDPNFSFGGKHNHNESGSSLLAGGFSIPGSKSDTDSFNTGLGGALPWGMTYNLQGNVSDTTGTSFSMNTNGLLVANSFGSSVGSASATVTQPLLKNLWIDNNRLTIRVAKNRLKYSEQNLRLQIMQTATTLEKAYYDLIYNQENVGVQQKALEAAQRLVVENRKKVEVGSLAPLDLESAEAQAASSEAALIAARSNLEVQQNTIKQLVTGQYSQWADTTVASSATLSAPRQFFSRQDSWSKGLSQRPELLQAKLDVKKAGVQLKFDKNQLYPELDVSATYGYNGSGRVFSDALYDIQQTDRPFYTLGGTLTVPLTRTAARNTYRSDKALMEEAVLKVKKMERDIMFNIDNDLRQAQSSYEQVAALRKAREFAESDLAAEQKKLESGKSTTYTVLLKQRDLTTARGNEIQALATYNKNLSQLSLDEASTFDRLNINLQVK